MAIDLVKLLISAAVKLPPHLTAGEISTEKILFAGQLLELFKVPKQTFASQTFRNKRRDNEIGGGCTLFLYDEHVFSNAAIINLTNLVLKSRGRGVKLFATQIKNRGNERVGITSGAHHDLVHRFDYRNIALIWMTDTTNAVVENYEKRLGRLIKNAWLEAAVDEALD